MTQKPKQLGDLTWLTVTGAARSGTTYLEQSIAKSANAAILHECDPIELVLAAARVAVQHAEPERFPEIEQVGNRRFIWPDDIGLILRRIVGAKFADDVRIYGTKDPEWWLRQAYMLPPCFQHRKQLNIMRRPGETIPRIKKILAQRGHIPENTLHGLRYAGEALWIIAWNNALTAARTLPNASFLNIFYEALDNGRDFIATEVGNFLSAPAVSFDDWTPQEREASRFTAEHADLTELDKRWSDVVNNGLQNESLIGYPAVIPGTIDLKSSLGLQYAHIGFGYPMAGIGSWLQGSKGTVLFRITNPIPKMIKCSVIITKYYIAKPELTKLYLNDSALKVSYDFKQLEQGIFTVSASFPAALLNCDAANALDIIADNSAIPILNDHNLLDVRDTSLLIDTITFGNAG
jgi:hypothetical protein